MVTLEAVRQVARALPGVEERELLGAPAFRVRGRLFARLLPEGDAIVVKIDLDERDRRVPARYLNYPWMMVKLAEVQSEELRDLLLEAWRRTAPDRLVATHRDVLTARERKRPVPGS